MLREVKITAPDGAILTKKTSASSDKNIVLIFKSPTKGVWVISSMHKSMDHAKKNASGILNDAIKEVHYGPNEA